MPVQVNAYVRGRVPERARNRICSSSGSGRRLPVADSPVFGALVQWGGAR